MNKIKVIDLLNMISKGEEVPKKIKVTGTIYEYDEEYEFYFTKTKEGKVALGGKRNEINLIYNFNNEVEIIEEEKKLPEKINVKGSYNSNKGYEDFNDNEKILVDKINDLLDYLESKEKGE